MLPKSAKMKVTPNDLTKEKEHIYHFSCWMDIATEEELLGISKAWMEQKRKLNER